MGLVHASVELRNALDSRLEPFRADALVDTGALLLCIPEHVATQLKLPQLQEREATTADGKRHICPYAGPIEVTSKNLPASWERSFLGKRCSEALLPWLDWAFHEVKSAASG